MTTNTKPWYEIRAQRPAAQAAGAAAVQASAEILIYGDIGESWYGESVSAAQFVRDLAAIDASQITIRINSIGGSVPDGIAIHNAIKRHPANITTVVDAAAMSVASLIAIAGDQVQMAENAVLMIHAPWTWAEGNAVQLRELADMLDVWTQAMAVSYAAKCGKPVTEVVGLLADGADHFYTAEQALEAGFIDAVVAGVPVAAMARPDSAYLNRLPAAVAARFGLGNAPAANPHPTGGSAPNHQEPVAMTQPTPSQPQMPVQAAAVDAAHSAQLDAARAAGVRAESDRRVAVAAAFAPFARHEGMADVQAACLADLAVTADVANQRILAQMGKGVTPCGAVVTVEDERDKFLAGATQAILARAGVVGADGLPIRAEGANPWRGLSMMDHARASLQRAGINAAGKDKLQVVGSAFTQSTSDFPVLLENAMYKTLQLAYAVAADTWSRFCSRGSVSDFRANPRYRVGSLGNLDAKTEMGEYRNKTIPDGEKASVKIGTKGNTINISREAIINDDLGAFIGLSAMLGRAAKRTVEADVYALLASNPTMGDGVALFHATHGNLAGTGAVPTVSAVDAARVAMAAQKDISGNDFLDIRPSVALSPLSLGSTIRLINNNEYDPSTTNKFQVSNVCRGMFSDVVDTPRLTGTGWYLFAAPTDAPVFEVAFLDGNDTPFLEMRDGWDVDGSEWKVRLDFGIAAIDYRGAYFNPGA